MRLLLAAMLFAITLPVAAVEPAAVLEKAVDDFIRPGFAQLADEAEGLRDELGALCSSPSQENLEAAQAQFKILVTAHSRVEFLRFGPLTEDSRAERLLFWPDRKGIALRQVQAILGDQDGTATGLEDLRRKSIAVQGLGALDYVLFGEGSEALAASGAEFRCHYAQAIGAALAVTADELDSAWSKVDGIAEHLASPQPGNDDYRTERESLEELVGAMSHGIEAIRDSRLLPFVGRDDETPKPKSALFWRSGMTIPAIRAGFEGMRDLLATSQIAQAASQESRWVEGTTLFEFGNALRAADLVSSPVAEALADPRQRQALDYMIIVTGSLQTLLGESLSQALGLSVGFSSLDGD